MNAEEMTTGRRAGRFASPVRAARDVIPLSPIPAVNAASVPQRRPLGFPGGKTWLILRMRVWLRSLNPVPDFSSNPSPSAGSFR